jgi:hypothetical protein
MSDCFGVSRAEENGNMMCLEYDEWEYCEERAAKLIT